MIKSADKKTVRPRETTQAITLASRWLLSSGIHNLSSDKKLRGGVAAWYETAAKTYPFLYSEITGYTLSTCLFLHRVTGDRQWVERAHEGAGWLMRNAIQENGGVKTRLYLDPASALSQYSFDQGRVYSFDTAMVGYGMLQLYQASERPEYLEAIQKIFRFLSGPMRKKSGIFHSYYDPEKNKAGEDDGKWSDQTGSFHAKHALFFIDHSRVTRQARGREIALTLLDETKKMQLKDGRFVTGKKDGSTLLHPHAYTLEGLLYGAVHLDRPDYLEAALKGFDWMMKAAGKDGSVAALYEEGAFVPGERCDIVAQTLRIGSILFALKPDQLRPHLASLAKIKGHLLSFQYEGNSGQSGGFLYQNDPRAKNQHLNSWCTMFSLQGLWMHDEFVVRKKPLMIDSLV